MHSIRNNRVFKKSILGFFLFLFVFTPASLSFTSKTSARISDPVSILVFTSNQAHALGSNGAQSNQPIDTSGADATAADIAALNKTSAEARAEADAAAKKKEDTADAKSDTGGFWSGVGSSLGAWLGNAILNLAALITWVGGRLLEVVTSSLVFGMGDWVAKNSDFGNAIDNTWEILRDICNLIFIFGFIYTGIRTILDPESAETKRFVAKIIIAALLINFSLFFVKMIIDFSNFAAYQIYISMVEGSGTLSAKIADTLGIITIWGPSKPDVLASITKGGSISFFIMAALFLIIAAFVFIGAAVLLISRFVTLIYIMVASPILFAATVFPQTEEYASNLWHKLISAAFFAPAYFLLTLISLRLLEGLPLKGVGKGGNFVEALNPLDGSGAVESGSFEIILFFVLAIFFLVSSLTIAHSMGIKGSEMVIKKTKAAIGASTAGLAAKAFRASAGQIAHNISEKDGLKDAASQSGLKGWSARRALQASRAVGDASMDVRNVNGAGNAMGIGEGRKGGYTSALKDVKEKEEKYAKSLGEIGDDDVRVMERKEQEKIAKKNVEQQKEELEKLKKQRAVALDHNPRANVSGLDAAIALQKDAIHHAEEDAEKAKIKIEQEKMRRQTGSTFAESADPAVQAEIARQKTVIEGQENRLKNEIGLLARGVDATGRRLSKAEIATNRTILEGNLKNLKATKDEHEAYLSAQLDRGYAGVLEDSGHIVSWIEGRTIAQNRESGKAIRKARKKGKPSDSGSHGGGHAPAHTPTPAAGGGGHGGAHGGGGHGHP